MEGYFVTHGLASALELAGKSAAKSKCFVLNFSAPFIPQFFMPGKHHPSSELPAPLMPTPL